MKYILWAIGVPIGLMLAFLVVQTLASERVEVIDLYTTDESGDTQTTRLWVMDDEGYQYLRVGADGSGWFDRILDNGDIEVGRDGVTAAYAVVQRPDKSERINDMMQESTPGEIRSSQRCWAAAKVLFRLSYILSIRSNTQNCHSRRTKYRCGLSYSPARAQSSRPPDSWLRIVPPKRSCHP